MFTNHTSLKFLQLIDQLEYNTEREKLIIPEYGRHLQKMVNQAIAEEDEKKRNIIARSIIAVWVIYNLILEMFQTFNTSFGISYL